MATAHEHGLVRGPVRVSFQIHAQDLVPIVDVLANKKRAVAELRLTPQEQFLYDHHLNNLYSPNRVIQPDGFISTIYQMNTNIGGRYYNLPTVWGGRILDPRAAIERAQQVGLDRFPSYASPEEAEQRYQRMHQYMERDTQAMPMIAPGQFSGR